ncbi:aromatic oxygenase [Novosphingobium marinum]|uniref:Phenylpropionate dioxygenase-like ring-hydroxylating dioxygenase large terminal subunit n=1 Tax=Novosphingobium marinum TaxID=1514948 RepID=A0A7Z0BWB9_9SPHN|nr:aromatic ring-hydroxylating dioxygenase subunit alpha [Novosphingobium marinum]NYH97173.1 phenylpropionate dioxygenase-like ring-hydroxylating dioxygenase large terminal subunit [Novosphingobium marinum]GGC44321.1 aromatic oxygenase [Novosphingobium marinum]
MGSQQAYQQDIVWPAKFNEIPKEIFVRSDLYEAEINRIFRGPEWHPVAHESEVPNPGDFKTCNLADVPLLVMRGDDNQVRVFYNACSHRSNQIEVKPAGNRREFECPYHRWLFNSKGELVGCPNQREFTPDFNKKDFPLAQPRQEAVGGLIFVTLSAETEPLDDFLQEARESLMGIMGGDGRLKLIGYQRVRYLTNWKAYGDNDGYHPPLLHQAFSMLNWQGGEGRQYATSSRGHYCIDTELTTPPPTKKIRDASVIQFRDEGRPKRSSVLALFPMLVASNYLNVISIRFATPVAIDEVEVNYTYFAHEDDDEEMVLHRIRQCSNAIGPSGLISMEDASVFHRVQIGNRTPGNAVFQKGVRDPMRLGFEFLQNDESANLPHWEYYRSAMGFRRAAL